MIDTHVNEAIALEDYLAGKITRDQSAIKELNDTYVKIHTFRSGGRKTPKKVAIKMGAAYVASERARLSLSI